MKYLVVFFLFLSFVFSIVFFQATKKRIKAAFIKNLLVKHFKEQKRPFNNLLLFPGVLACLASDIILNSKRKIQKKIIEDLRKNDLDSLMNYIREKDTLLAQSLFSLLGRPHKKIFQAEKLKQSRFSYLMNCLYFECTSQYPDLSEKIKKTPFFSLSSKYKALKNIFHARNFFIQTDFKKASKLLIKNTKILQKSTYTDELAYSYFMLGEIYNLAGHFDTAEMMFTSAIKIYNKTNQLYGQNLVLTALSLNCKDQGRFDQAHAHLDKALKTYKKHKDNNHEAEILNQKAILFNLQKMSVPAKRNAMKALKNYQTLKNRAGSAVSFEQIAIANYNSEKWKIAKKYALEAKKRYVLEKNAPSILRVIILLLKTEIEQQQLENAQKLFRELKRLIRKEHFDFSNEDLQNLQNDINKKNHI